MAVFYTPDLLENQQSLILPEEESKHVCKVLRMQTNDILYLVNGKGLKAKAKIKIADIRKCEVEIIERELTAAPIHHLHIAIAPTKNLDRIEWFVEKATEIGVDEISFLLCDRSERKILKLERIEKIMISAFKQSQRLHLPILNNLTPFKEFTAKNPGGMIAHCDEMMSLNSFKSNSINSKLNTQKTIVLIGPEGDFTENEVKDALKNQYQEISLGKNRLRTETAALYATMQLKLIFDL